MLDLFIYYDCFCSFFPSFTFLQHDELCYVEKYWLDWNSKAPNSFVFLPLNRRTARASNMLHNSPQIHMHTCLRTLVLLSCWSSAQSVSQVSLGVARVRLMESDNGQRHLLIRNWMRTRYSTHLVRLKETHFNCCLLQSVTVTNSKQESLQLAWLTTQSHIIQNTHNFNENILSFSFK